MLLNFRNRLLGGTSPHALSIDGAAPEATGGGEQSPIVERSASGDGPISLRDGANSLLDARRKEAAAQRGEQEQTGEARDAATADNSTAQADDAAPETGPGETKEGDQQAEKLAPVDPPRSWTKEDKELFKGLPRETQERLVERERSREGDFLKRQQTAAEQSKALTAKETAAEQVRTQYEQALPMLLQALQAQQQGQFADIRSIADVEKMAAEDWPRYVQWDAQQKKVAVVQQEVTAAQQRAQAEKATQWQTFAREQDALLIEKAPDLANAEVNAKVARNAADMLKDLGFSDGELGEMWHGQRGLSLRDHRIQLLIRDGVKYREAQAAAKKPAPRPVPNVQRPGPAPARGADADGKVKDLTERLNQSGNLRDAAALLAARRASQRR